MNIKQAINEVVDLKDLALSDAYDVASEIMSGRASQAQIAALLIGLRMKGETVEEITGFVKVMREKAVAIPCRRKDLIDTCGSGGDHAHTFNVSTLAALVASGAGCAVAKHGNRSISSMCGSADLLEQLGVCLELPPEKVGQCIDEIGFGFLYAPLLHRAMKYAAAPRKELGMRTIFNILGPLTNPAGARRQLIGVFDRALVHQIACVLKNCNAEHVMVAHSADGLDEISNTGTTYISELYNGTIKDYTIEPEDFGIKRTTLTALQVSSIEESVESALSILNGQTGPRTDMVVLNAGAAIYVSGRAQDLKEGIKMARSSIESGCARERLEQLRLVTQ